MFLGALGLGPSEWAKREISALCESIEKAYEIIDVYQQGKGKRDRITFARKGPFLLVLRDGPCGGFREHGVSAGRMEKRAVQHKYYENDYLCYVRVVTDADEEVLEHNDYSGFGQRLESSTGSANRYRYNGKEEQVTGSLGLIDYGARLYDNLLPRWTTPDPLAEKYYSYSPYAFCNNNPVNFVDPDGRSTWVVANPDGTYTIEGGNLDDNDLNIYVVTYDEDDNMIIGESIGKTSSITSFYDGDKDDNNEIKGWKTGSVINPNDRSGWEFISELVITDPSLVEYMLGARKNERYDFKVTNGTNTKVADIDIYRGMPIFKDVNGTVIYSSARDVGNILAGFIAGKKGLS